MVAQVHRERQIRSRQTVTNGVRLKNRKSGGRLRRRVQIHADDLDTQPALDLAENAAARAPDIQNAAYRQRIAASGCDYPMGVAEEPVDLRQVPIGSFDEFLGYTATIEDFDVGGLLHR